MTYPAPDPTAPSLAEFLLARVAEDEQIAQEATLGPWTAYGDGILLGTSSNPEVCRGVKTWNMWHLSTFDPARVLAQCAAVRAVVETCRSDYEDALTSGDDTGDLATEVLRALATVYAEHEGYRAEWAK